MPAAASACFNVSYGAHRTTRGFSRHSRTHAVPAGNLEALKRTRGRPALRPSTLSQGERELVATYVSSQNDCTYCHSIHGAIAAHRLGGDENLVQCVKTDFEHAEISDKLKALLAIAGKVQRGGKNVIADDVARARDLGATDLEIHDTVLIAAFFCLANRYVDGLATWTPEDPDFYRQRAKVVAANGYSAAVKTPGANGQSSPASRD